MLNDENAVVHDYSALEAATGRKNAGSKARLYISSGLGLLLAGTGIGLAAYGLSFVIPPRIVTTEKVVVETKVERIEVPKIVENQTLKIVEVPKFIGGVESRVSERTTKPTNESPGSSQVSETPLETRTGAQIDSSSETQTSRGSAISPPPPLSEPTGQLRVGAAFTPKSFSLTRDFINSQCSGRLVSHIEGRLLFNNGVTCFDATPDGQVDIRVTSTRHNGDLATCAKTGTRFPNGVEGVECYALHNGWVERISDTTASDTASKNDPIQELLNPN